MALNASALARALSVVGHPALLMPGAAVWSAASKNAAPQLVHAVAAAAVGVAVSVVAYALFQVRAGRWQHADASQPRERQQLNFFLVTLLFAMAALLYTAGQPRPVFLGAAWCGLLVVLALLLRRWLKMSLHAAFAVFAALLLWPSVPAVVLLLVLAAGVAWSRLVLGRHTHHEVLVGLLAGGLAGLTLKLVAA